MSALKATRRIVDGVVNWLSICMFIVIFLVVIAQIFWRYILGSPLVWSEELSRAIFIWVSLVGWVLATRNGTHIRITFFNDRLPELPKKALRALFRLVTVAFLATLAWYGSIMVQRTMGRSLITVPAIPIAMLYLSLPVTAAFGIFYNIYDIFVPGGKDTPAAME